MKLILTRNKIIYIKGYLRARTKGVNGNGRPNELARKGSEIVFIGPEPACDISYCSAEGTEMS